MPVHVSVKTDWARMERALTDLQRRQLPFATAAALTDTAKAAQIAVTKALPQIFDKPIAFTLRAIAFKPATKSSLSASVFLRPIQAQYLLHEEIGGTRTPAENTRKTAAALLLPSKIKLNAYGNIPSGFLKRLMLADAKRELTAKQSRRKEGYEKVRKERDRGFFYLKGHGIGGQGPGGIFKRLPNHQVQRLVSFEPHAEYKPRFHFRDRVQLVAKQTFAPALKRRLMEALRDAH